MVHMDKKMMDGEKVLKKYHFRMISEILKFYSVHIILEIVN